MFDFFAEIIEFLSQIVYMINWGFGYLRSVIDLTSDKMAQFQPVLSAIPAPIAALILFVIASYIFDFVRGRSR